MLSVSSENITTTTTLSSCVILLASSEERHRKRHSVKISDTGKQGAEHTETHTYTDNQKDTYTLTERKRNRD